MPEARYYEFYAPYLELGTVKGDGFTACRCPFHQDAHPSAGVNLENGVFNCFSCGRKFSAVKFYSELTGASPQEARCLVENYLIQNELYEHTDNFVKASPGKNPKFEKLLAESEEITDQEIAVEYAEGRNLRIETLRALGVRFAKAENTHWNRDSLVFPYFYNGYVVGLRYRDAEGNKSGEPGCHYTLWGLDELDNEGRAVVVVEGESDRAAFWQMVEGAVPVVSTPGAVFRKEWEREFFGFTRVILIPHSDNAGQKQVATAKSVLGAKLSVYNLNWKRGQIGKDICDWLVNNDPQELARDVLGLAKTGKRAGIMTAVEFKQEADRPRRFFINELFARGQVAVIAGPPKNKKTLLTLDMIRTILTPGECFLGKPEFESKIENCKILFLEEEGDIEEFYERAERVLSGTNWMESTYWGHRVGLKIDTDEGTQEIINFIDENKIDLLFLDPFSKMFSIEEDKATEIGIVWNNIDRILQTCPDVGIVILHHFSKNASINDLWNALRGSSRIAASADLGIFVQNRESKEPDGVKFRLDGRTLKGVKAHDGGDIFKAVFNPATGRFKIDEGIVIIDKSEKLVDATKTNGPWSVEDAAKTLGVTTATIRNWLKKREKELKMEDNLIIYVEN